MSCEPKQIAFDEPRAPGCDPKQVPRYVAGELAPEAAAIVRAHAGACASCRELLHAEQALDWALGGLDDFAPPAGFAEVTVARARCDVTHAVANPREWRRAAIASASLSGLTLALLWPTGVFDSALALLAPLQCLSRFAAGWVASAATGSCIVGRTVSRHLFEQASVSIAGAGLLLVALLVAIGALVTRFHERQQRQQGSAAETRSR